MAVTLSSTEARASLPDLLDRVQAGDEVTITRHGRPVAIVVRPDALRARRAGGADATAARVRAALTEGRSSPLSSIEALSAGRADELVSEVRAGRART